MDMAPLDPYLSPQAQQAVVAGAFLAFGWWYVARDNRRRDSEQRAARVRDMQRALYAEIRAYLAALERDALSQYGQRMAARIESDSGYFPIIPTEHNDAVFRALVAQIHVLPRDTIDPVVLYYSQLNAIGAMIADLREVGSRDIGAERKAAMYRDYIAMKIGALELGRAALAAIRSNVDGRGGVNSPASGRSER